MLTLDQVQSRLHRIRRLPRLMEDDETLHYSIKDVCKGWVIKVNGILFTVLEISTYVERHKNETWKWFELKLEDLVSGETAFLEWEEDDFIEIFLYSDKKRLSEFNLSRRQLMEMDDEEEGSFHYEGQEFEYDDSGDATYYRGCSPDDDLPPRSGEKFYYWDFYNDTESICIGVEMWGDSEFEVCIGKEVKESSVKIVAKGG